VELYQQWGTTVLKEKPSPVPLCPPQTPNREAGTESRPVQREAKNCLSHGLDLGLCSDKPTTDRLSHNMTQHQVPLYLNCTFIYELRSINCSEPTAQHNTKCSFYDGPSMSRGFTYSPFFQEKPHKCGQCSKSFPTPGDLKAHMYIHSGSWPYRCNVCSRGFSKQTNLRNHLFLHTGTLVKSAHFIFRTSICC